MNCELETEWNEMNWKRYGDDKIIQKVYTQTHAQAQYTQFDCSSSAYHHQEA